MSCCHSGSKDTKQFSLARLSPLLTNGYADKINHFCPTGQLAAGNYSGTKICCLLWLAHHIPTREKFCIVYLITFLSNPYRRTDWKYASICERNIETLCPWTNKTTLILTNYVYKDQKDKKNRKSLKILKRVCNYAFFFVMNKITPAYLRDSLTSNKKFSFNSFHAPLNHALGTKFSFQIRSQKSWIIKWYVICWVNRSRRRDCRPPSRAKCSLQPH